MIHDSEAQFLERAKNMLCHVTDWFFYKCFFYFCCTIRSVKVNFIESVKIIPLFDS